MKLRKLFTVLLFIALFASASYFLGGSKWANAEKGFQPPPNKNTGDITPADREAAAAANAAAGLQVPERGSESMMMSGEAPHYYGPFPNYANSPLPVITGAVIPVGNPLVQRTYATDFASPAVTPVPVFVVVPGAVLPDGLVQSFQTFNQTVPGGSPTSSEGNLFHAYVLRPTGQPNEYQVIFDSGPLTVPPSTNPAGQVETFPVPDIAVQDGDVIGFYGAGIPVDIVSTGTDLFSYPAPAAPLQNSTLTLGGSDYPLYGQARTYSFGANVLDLSGNNTMITGGIRKFVDGLPGVGPSGANNLGQYIPVAQSDTTTYPGSDYYEIALVEYEEKMHSDLPPTTLRGYVQLSTSVIPGDQIPLFNPDGSPIMLPNGQQAIAVDEPHYMGPLIAAEKDRPVRILFRNLLPTGEAGNLFLPVDTTVMGSGMGPDMNGMHEMDPQNPMCGMVPKPYDCYTENRATLHLHGGITPWISDGTPHQWVTPANENTPYPEGVSVEHVPDMPDPGPGAMTFFYTNQQSARLMFYHDHAWGITRLNVYAGEAAAYLITDPTEQSLVNQGIIPADQIPLVIQDKTFVPEMDQLAVQDPTWDLSRWGDYGDLWVPHVYVPAQNPGDSSGVNQYGRWAYGPWFWPPTTNIDYGPIDNPHYDPDCDPDVTWCEPPLIPGVPFVSMGMEAFNDTPVVNGTLYPTLTLEPKSYRFRILNAANDRFWNLSLYVADATGTEVALNAAEVLAALSDPTIFPTPDTNLSPAGPDWIQIGTEGGFLPAPAVIPAQFTTWVTDPTVFNAGNVDQHSLLLGPAERADVIVDFSQFAGQTLILYNDAPAAFPARDPRYDYYTGNPDLRDTGGAPATLPGYGPNTRTVMQIKIAPLTPAPAFNLNALETAFRATSLGGQGVFETSQHPIIVGQNAYNSAYGTSFPLNGPNAGLVQIYNTQFTFKTLLGSTLTFPLDPKQIQDEMGEAFEQDYGRMSGFLGVETPNPQAGQQNMILYPFMFPPTEIINGLELPPGMEVTPIASTDDGTQIWKITHNGVDTHPIHFHLYDVQLINRVGWDGIIRRPDPNELGWKDTVRVSPLEDTIVALRPIIPTLPFDLPNSIRLLDPSMPEGAILANSTLAEQNGLAPLAFAPNGEPIDIVNHFINFGWEYVWHCHILSHEEMDMMRPQAVVVTPRVPSDLIVTWDGGTATLTWTDNSLNETAFIVQRATNNTFTEGLVTFTVGMDVTTFSDVISNANGTYYYRVQADNVVGDTWDYSDPNLNEGALFPTKSLRSEFTNTAMVEVNNPPSGLYFSTVGGGNTNPIPGLAGPYDDAHLYTWDGTAFGQLWNATAIGLPTNANVDGLVMVNANQFYLSFTADETVLPGVGSVQDEDVVYYDNGVWSVYFDGTAQGLTTTGRDLDGFEIADGLLYFSTLGTGNTNSIPGVAGPYDDADIYTWDGASFSRFFDASVAGLLTNANVDGMVIEDAQHFYLSFAADTALPGLGTVQDEDVVFYSNGVWSVYFDGTALSLTTAGQDLDAFEIGPILIPPATPSNLVALLETTTQVNLSWTDNATNELGFTIERAVVTGGVPEPFAEVATVGADVNSYSDTTVTPDTTYLYRVLAFNADGNSLWSNEVTIITSTQQSGLYFATAAASTIPGVPGPYDDADIYTWNGAAFGRLFDASVAGLPGNANVDGMVIVDATHFYLSFTADVVLPGLGAVQDEDVVYCDNGVWSVYFDGTALGLTNAGHDLDAISLVNGILYFSTTGTGNTSAIPGVTGPYDDADIYTWDGTVFSRWYDASAAGLLANANVDGMVIVDATQFYLSFTADTGLPNLGIVEDEDVVYFNSGVWSVYFDGTAQGLTTNGHDINAFDLP
ncbi:MAG: multicopper oxidase domain-containing protein [Chloroflexi bacterium]|nr:multicopper oxidase domain-containing protein [Chloroflexota bacterium]